jgi:hypothetical protein
VLPEANEELLTKLCERLTDKALGRRDLSRSSGQCPFGLYGSVVVKGEKPAYLQVWVVSNRRDFILITHTCENEPSSHEMEEANQIALMTSYE